MVTSYLKLACSNPKFLTSDIECLRLCYSKSMSALVKLAPGWALIQINFDTIQAIWPKVEGGHSFETLLVIVKGYFKYMLVTSVAGV